MSPYNCGYCLLAEETEERSSDLVYCWFKEELRKINDYPCCRFKEGGALRKEIES